MNKYQGTTESCSFCGKNFGPSYSPTRKHIHYIFRVVTKIGIFTGATHGNCVEKLRDRQLAGIQISN